MMVYLLILLAIFVFFDYIPAFHGKIRKNKRDFIAFICFVSVAIVLFSLFTLDIKFPLLETLGDFFKDIGIIYPQPN